MYPINHDLRGRQCVVVGGGAVAERKVLGLLAAGALVRLVSPEVTPALQRLACEGGIVWLQQDFAAEDLADAFLVFAATSSAHAQAQVRLAATRTGCLLNMADAPALCDFHVPAVLRRGEILLTVSTSGASPALAAALKARLDKEIGEEYAVLARLLAALRSRLLALPLCGAEKKMLFQKMLDSDIVEWIRDDQRKQIAHHVHSVFGHLLAVESILNALWTDRKP